jgi:hypothetical protein
MITVCLRNKFLEKSYTLELEVIVLSFKKKKSRKKNRIEGLGYTKLNINKSGFEGLIGQSETVMTQIHYK